MPAGEVAVFMVAVSMVADGTSGVALLVWAERDDAAEEARSDGTSPLPPCATVTHNVSPLSIDRALFRFPLPTVVARAATAIARKSMLCKNQWTGYRQWVCKGLFF